ncbi:MAG: hypothetical protein COZ06_31265 [Armatimonadetes bacterium CG_4_10_14_3_um_filter_66_18]|nr:hypothetical protein [Armatimonadota bacterium]OIP05976.1 MAG: hypothetical protein AUJ96_09795 [Armatimonadetes bacterium CG2_30_66_41]PIU95789.1 MAG: hypothetical protein COS65_00665 [Armatimonadetes bacterium CG06_land_8_20_14_3_00_66_21]PIX37003.1 MAG: hypothetical protein COZ57_36550 [Armatimonadetes bacterium CG_4_8_14_3_um_filter_66_20]PIY38433.1 MAG: hypothetical protein COZ06_31265 [Armatimonadetes bacterium CG_4_10_14_3_um_filter_66_18]PIZ45848.1 MAG: hypothetical protein COY42_11
MNQGLYFAQLTDLHVGNNDLNGEQAKRNLRLALEELEHLTPQPQCVLVTADLVCSGRRDELEVYCSLVDGTPLDLYAVPANHDLWGEPDGSAWEEWLGPTRHAVDMDGLRVVLFDDLRRQPDGAWKAIVPPEQMDWLDSQLAGAEGRTKLVAYHAPILPEGDNYHDNWRDSNADEFLALLRGHDVRSMITGHWHRCGEWTVGGVQTINAGALTGWQWTGIPPYWSFPVRPGYRLFHFDAGVLRTFWRELGSQEMRAPAQIGLVHVGGVHTGGPRPQVRPVSVFASVPLHVQTWSSEAPVDSVEWSVAHGDWRPMTATWDGLWTDWEAQLDWQQVRAGECTCVVRARRDGRPVAYDAVPLTVSEWHSPPMANAVPQRERVFELFYVPE